MTDYLIKRKDIDKWFERKSRELQAAYTAKVIAFNKRFLLEQKRAQD